MRPYRKSGLLAALSAALLLAASPAGQADQADQTGENVLSSLGDAALTLSAFTNRFYKTAGGRSDVTVAQFKHPN